MKRLFLLCVLPSALCLRVWGQSYSIDWSTIDGGGGTGTGGVYTVSGTIGQPDAGAISAGTFTLSGGFWGSVAVVQTYGAPWLSLYLTATNTVAVVWPNADPNWKLHWTENLSATASWTEVSPPYPTHGTNCVYVEQFPNGQPFLSPAQTVKRAA